MTDQLPTDTPNAAPRGRRDDMSQPNVFLVVVDNTTEMRVALRFASRRAKRTGGRVGLLRVIRKADFQHWAAIGNLMREEARDEAEQLLQEHAATVTELTGGEMPILYIKEGGTKSALVQLIDEDSQIRILVLAASTNVRGPGPLITFLMKKIIAKLRIPVTIVPGSLTNEQIDTLT
ncbi:MAG: nucleotide-binding universal stress UspA family protein [Alphaproteobacteria bacterium]|jgi:nucleotide-binding universal stress UspA family protein